MTDDGEEESEWAHDPKMVSYEGDIKAALVEAIEANKHLLGPRVLIGRDSQGASPLFGPSPLEISRSEIETIVDRKVTQLIGELLEFNHTYTMEDHLDRDVTAVNNSATSNSGPSNPTS